jgi:putative Mn2+ efflux pump MntP
MGFAELMLVALGLSMDAFAVSICKGLGLRRETLYKAGIVGLYFGAFQAGMPLLGYVLGVGFQTRIASYDHWIAFVLLAFIGIKMIREAGKEASCDISPIEFKGMLVLSVATSIDALAVGITFAFLGVPIVQACLLIGTTTFLLSVLGCGVGHLFGSRFQKQAEWGGGLILIGIGVKILVEHLLK